MEAFRLDLIDMPLIANPAAEVDGLIDQDNVGLASLLYKHAPLRQREITVRPENFWNTGEIETTRRSQHSTETTLLRVYNDLLLAVDDGDAAVLVLLDFSAAFDTIDHGILLRRLDSRFEIRGKTFEWMESYVTGRHQAVLIDGYISSHIPLRYGVPQDSVLGPMVFTLYTSPLHALISAFGINCHFFSDDTQLYKIFQFSRRLVLHGCSQQETCRLLVSCISAIQGWAVENKLSLNVAKTDSLTVSAEKAAVPASIIDLGEEVIISSPPVRNLGVIFVANLKMDKHVSDLCRRGFYHIRRIALIRKYLVHDATTRLISAFVLSLLAPTRTIHTPRQYLNSYFNACFTVS